MGAFVANKGFEMAEDGSNSHIGVVAGFFCGKSFLLKTMPKVQKVTEFKVSQDLFAALSAGEVNVALTCPLANAKKEMDEGKHEVIKVVRGFNEGLGFMCSPRVPQKVAWLNVGLQSVRKSGQLESLCAKYPKVKCEFERTLSPAKGGVEG